MSMRIGFLVLTLCLLEVLGSVLETRCPPDKPRVYCFVDPCMSARRRGCPSYPTAQCRANYCGGCNAEWWYGGKKVDCNARPECPQLQCLVFPCDRRFASCPAYPRATCRPCGCTAEWYYGGRKVDCSQKPRKNTCPPGVPEVRCFINPCHKSIASCPAYPTATCRSNYCGGCNAEWYVGGRKVNCNSRPPPSIGCPPGVPEFRCFRDPCDSRFESCPNYPGAICRSNYCGGCNAVWYHQGRIVTDCSGAST